MNTIKKHNIVKTLLFVATIIALFSEILLVVNNKLPNAYSKPMYIILGNLFVIIILARELVTKKCLYGWIALLCMIIINIANILYTLMPNELYFIYNYYLPLCLQIISTLAALKYLKKEYIDNVSIQKPILHNKIMGGVAIPFIPRNTKLDLGIKTVYIDVSDQENNKYQYSIYTNGCLTFNSEIEEYLTGEDLLAHIENI